MINKRKTLRSIIAFIVIGSQLVFLQQASGAATWTASSSRDSYNRPDLDSRYDIEYVSSTIFDNSLDQIYFYLHFANKPSVDLFNDGKSWAYIGLDYDSDNKSDIRLEIFNKLLRSDRVSISSDVYDTRTQKFSSCNVDVFTNIDEGRWWIGFAVSRVCIALPQSFGIQGYSDYIEGDDKSFDYAPDSHFKVTLPGSGGSTNSSNGQTLQIPTNLPNESTLQKNFSTPPVNLTTLSEKLSPSVVTIFCGNGKGSGWAIKSELSQSLKANGYLTYIITNHHVIEDCISSKKVNVQLSTNSQVSGSLIAWNENSDIAGIAISSTLPGLEWIGSTPKQGWWVGVLGSPGSLTGILTTGIISSINTDASTFTFTAAINPGNSGGPVFDSTGRVLGLATSKFLLSNGALAEGSGNAHGVPLLCGTVITCEIERKPWDAISKFTAGPSAEELEAKAKAEAEAKAKAELELKLKEQNFKQCQDINGDLKVSILNLNTSKSIYPKSASVFQGLINSAPRELDCQSGITSDFDSIVFNQRKLMAAFEVALSAAISNAKVIAAKKSTITCIKGKLTKKVTGINPICPAGYKKK